MKKKIALFLCLVMIVSVCLCGCGDQKKLVGSWTATMNLAEALNAEIAAGDPEIAEYVQISNFDLTIDLTFNADDTYTFEVDMDALDDSMNGMIEEMKDAMLVYLEDMLAAEGIDMPIEEVLAMSGMDIDVLVEEAYASLLAENPFEELNQEGKYKADNGKLFMSESLDENVGLGYERYTLDGNTLTIEAGNMDVDLEEYLYPMVFHKVG